MIVGRDAVVGEAWRALSTGGRVVLHGPAGIGKTAVLRTLLGRAETSGWAVLTCAPAESETLLSFAALEDLLRPLAHLVAELPGPQRTAADMVLLAADAPERAVDERAVGAATRSLLAAAAGADTPLLVAVDDAPWLDSASERALRFALRRVDVPVLVGSRVEGVPAVVPLGLDEALAIELEPLGVGALQHILQAKLGRMLNRSLLARLAEESGGNPLLVIELARAVLRLPRLPLPTEDLPLVGGSAVDLAAVALQDLPEESLEAIQLAALLTVPRIADLAAVGVPPSALEAAEVAGLVARTPRRITFAHPVYAAAVRSTLTPVRRRQLHQRLADQVADPDERARQLAWAHIDPDEEVATELAAAAARQRARGAPGMAAGLYARAAELTSTSTRGERVLAAARCRFDAGDYATAAEEAQTLAGESTGELKAQALLLAASIAFSEDVDGMSPATTIGEEALAAVAPDSVTAGRIHAHLASFADLPDEGRVHAARAVEVLEGSGHDQDLLSSALMLQLFHEVRAGLPARKELLERGLELEGDRPSWLAGTVPAIWWTGIDEHDRARDRLHRMLDWATTHGDEPWQHELLSHLGATEIFAGRWEAAAQHIAAARDLGEQLGTGLVQETWLRGMLAAHLGALGEAREIADEGLARAERLADGWGRRIHLHLLGFVELSAGRMRESAAAYTAMAVLNDELGLVEALSLRFEADWVEACAGAGEHETAALAMDRLQQRHSRLPRPWTGLGLARSRALLASTSGEGERALADLETALAEVPPDVVPLDRARCLLVAGMAHRRAKRKRQAKDLLTEAEVAFEALGAAAFAQRARDERARIGGRPAAPLDLSETELRVARLAAAGRTNRTIADELFLSPKTVEANLARVYQKLGISRRAELATALIARVSPDS